MEFRYQLEVEEQGGAEREPSIELAYKLNDGISKHCLFGFVCFPRFCVLSLPLILQLSRLLNLRIEGDLSSHIGY